MKRLKILFPLFACALMAHNASAELLRTEQFVGYESGTLGDDSTRGNLNGWNLNTAEITLQAGSGSLDGTSLGLVASEGDRAFISATGVNTSGNVIGARNQFAPNGSFPPSVEANLYYSFLYKFNNAADVSTGGEVIVQVNRANSGIGTTEPAPQNWFVVAKNAGGQIQLGIAKAGAPNNATNFAPATIAVGDTAFIVVRQHILPQPQNDIYDLWINPPAASFSVDEASVPAPDASVGTFPEEGAEDTSNTGPGRFVIFAGSNAEFDELRIGTSWADVTPAVGQCLPPTVEFTSETAIVQSAEIGATFTVQAGGTSPLLQWQVSTDSGATWQDIPGATAALYTTPNLALEQSGIQYRVIASNECSGLSVTSSIAFVTLTNPVVTPIGLVVHDTFTDPDLGFDSRANEPFSISNSLWYTAGELGEDPNEPGLFAYQQGGNLVGVPLTGSSSLWLGYYTAPGDPPVHLAVGTAIKVTLPFIPESYFSQTGNGSLRMGIFDYHDAGRRIIVDGSNVGGSRGEGSGVRGYLLNLNFGQTFTEASPLEIYARSFLLDENLMGTINDFQTLGEGPEGDFEGAPAFQAGTEYTLELTAARTAVNTMVITASITGGGTNWTVSVTDTTFAYHRFDSFAIRPNSLETSADRFTFPEFKVEVIEAPAAPLTPFLSDIGLIAPGTVRITWDSVPGINYHVLSASALGTSWMTNTTIQATDATTSYTNAPGTDVQFYRILAEP